MTPDEQERGPSRRLADGAVRIVVRHPWLSLLLLALALALSCRAYWVAVDGDLERQPADNSIGVWFLEDDPALLRYRAYLDRFGNDEVVLITLRGEPSVFTPATLDLVAEVSRELGAIRDVDSVTSLATVYYTGPAERDPATLSIEPMYRAPLDAAGAARVRRRVLDDPIYRRDLISEDQRTTLLSVRMGRLEDIDQRRGAVLREVEAALRRCCERAGRPPRDWSWGGLGVGNEALNDITREDTPKFTGLSLLIIALCLWVSLRRLLPVAVALLGVVAAVTLLWGVYLGLGYRLNMLSAILPSLVLVIGLSDSIYYLTTYYQEREGHEAAGLSKEEAIVASLGFCTLPGFYNSVTAAVGFLAFLSAKMPVVRELGLFAGVGILLAFVTSLVTCAAALAIFDLRPPRAAGAGPTEPGAPARVSPFDGFIAWVSDLVARHPRRILLASGVVFVASLAGILRLEVNSDPVNYFYADHPLIRDKEAIERDYGPAFPLELVVDSGRREGLKEPALLRGIEALEARALAREPAARNSVSLVGVVKRLARALDLPEAVPPGRDGVEQLLLNYDPDRADDPMRLVDRHYRAGRVTLRIRSLSSQELEALIARLEADGRAALPAGATAEAGGYPPLYVRLIEYLVDAQVSSLLWTTAIVFVLIGLLLRSLRYALLAIPPNVVPVALTLGVMGHAGIHLDGATVLIASVALGVAVNDTIHFLFKFRAAYERTGDDREALRYTLRSTGVAIVTSSLVVTLGFSVVALASLKSVAYFGILTGVTMLAALVGELLITPAVILTFRPRLAAPTAEAPTPGGSAGGADAL